MLRQKMTIEQGDNGWILSFFGHDSLGKRMVHKNWGEMLDEVTEYFGWWDSNGKQRWTNRG